MTDVRKIRFRFIAVLLSVLLIVSLFVPVLGTVKTTQVDAAGSTITFYFDTGGGSPGGSYGWSKGMSQVVYYCSNKPDSNDHGATELLFKSSDAKTAKMTLTSIKSKKDSVNGKVFKATVSSEYAGKYLTFSPFYDDSGVYQQKGYYRTARRDPIKVRDNIVVYLNGTEQDGYWQSWYYDLSKEALTDFTGQTFKIANLTEASESFTFKYKNSAGVVVKTITGQNVPARNLGTQFTIPAVENEGDEPFAGVEIVRESDSVTIKNYTFSTDPKKEKLRGKTLKYGITQYAEETPKYADDADFKTVSFSDEDYGTYPAVSDKYLYLANKGFKEAMAHSYTNITVKIGNDTYSVEPVTTNGNAAYVTTQKISVSDNQVFSVYCTYGDKTDIYNLVWNDSSKNLCVLGSGDVAQVTDEYSVQSTNNVLNGQKYLTVRADFFDYQYDTMNGSKYTYDLFSDATNHSVKTIDSQLGNAKRPYLAVNEAISASDYGRNTSVPMYLGQFWLPTDGNGIYFTSSTDAYNNTTAAKQKAGNNSYYQHNERYYASDQESGTHPNFGFGKNLNHFKWGANLAFRTTVQDSGTYRPFDAVAQGLVDNYLDGSTETSYTPGGKLKSGNVAVPYFDKSWWTGTFITSQNNTQINKADYLNLYENLDFPFFEIQSDEIKFQNGYTKDTLLSDTTDTYSGTYYVFDSKEYSIKVEQEGGKTSLKKSNYLHLNPTASDKYKDMVFDNYGSEGAAEATSKGQELGLFPFNSPSDTNKNKGYEDGSLHYGYGIRYDIDFYMTETGTVDGSPDGTAITFTFQGDDDVWVFLDGRLLLDMGGAHKNALGEINFKTKKTWISAIGQADTNNIISDNQNNSEQDDIITRSRVNVTESFSDWENRLTEGEHTITMFYMERGMLNSNLYCMFNLPTDITKLQIQNDTDFGKVNSAFLAATQYVADNDVFNYAIENKDTDQNLGSTYKALTGSDIFRNNTAGSYYMATRLAASSSVTSKTETITDLNSFYLNLASFSNWKGYSAKFGIIMLNDSGGAKFQMFTDTSDDNIKKVSRDNNYNKFVILRLLPSTYETKTYSSNGWDRVINYLKSVNGIDDGYWNRAPNRPDSKSFESNRNCYKITDWNSGDWDSNYTQTVTTTNQHTYNFNYSATADSDGFIPMISKSGGVTYEVRDYMAKDSYDNVLPVVYDSRQYNGAGDSNIVSLQYGELASFSKQFQANSRMRVTQLDSLSGVNSVSRVTDAGYNDSTGRKVSKYYSTYVKSQGNEDSLQKLPSAGIYKGNDVSGIKLADVTTMYEQESSGDYVLNDDLASKNYSNNTVINLQRNKTGEDVVTNYSFSDPEKTTNTNVFLRQVFVNAVNTVDLKIAKYMTGETSTKDFTFTLTFSNVFGSDDPNANSRIDVSALQYYLNDSTTPKPFTEYDNSAKSVTFILKPNEYITIKGIPVGTKYTINEDPDAAFVLDADSSTNIGYVNGVFTATELTDDTDVSWFNKRKTGAIRMRKLLYDADGTTKITTNTDDFEFVVNCTAPTGVAIGSYPIKYHTSGAPTAVNSLIWNKTETSPGVYQYSIVVNVKPEAVENNQDVIIEGIPVGTAYTVSENIKGAYAQLGEVEYTKGTSDTKDKEVEKLYTGSSMDDQIDLIKISNKIVPIIMPTTGGSGVVFIVPFGILAIVLSGAALMIYKKKTENGYNKGKGRYMK